MKSTTTARDTRLVARAPENSRKRTQVRIHSLVSLLNLAHYCTAQALSTILDFYRVEMHPLFQKIRSIFVATTVFGLKGQHLWFQVHALLPISDFSLFSALLPYFSVKELTETSRMVY